MQKKIILSTLNHTWLIDLDGTVVKHNGYLTDNKDAFVKGAKKFLNNIPKDDMIIFLTSRKNKYKKNTIEFLKKNKIRYNKILFNIPYGERILINDKKTNGLKTSIAINKLRNSPIDFNFLIDEKK